MPHLGHRRTRKHKLKIFALQVHPHRVVGAFSSFAKFAEAAGTSATYAREYGSETKNPVDLKRAMEEPGVLFLD